MIPIIFIDGTFNSSKLITSWVKTMIASWLIEIGEYLNTAWILVQVGTDASLRHSFITIDNGNEVFMKSYLENIKKQYFKNQTNFHELINRMKSFNKSKSDLYDEIERYHDTRNDLYHAPKHLTVSEKTIRNFIKISKTMYSTASGLEFEIDNIECGFKDLIDKIHENDWRVRFDELKRLEADIQNQFGLTPEDCQRDIFLGAHPTTISNVHAFELFFYGALALGEKNKKAIRVLEFISPSDENSWHDFYVSRIGSSTWYAIVGGLWSKWGKGNDPNIQRIYQMIKENKDRVEYKQSPRLYHYFYRKALDSFYSGWKTEDTSRYWNLKHS
jgi:hypothetical protein